MGFTLTKKRFLIWKTVMMVVAGLVVGGAIKLFWPEHYFAWFPFIPLYFYIFGWYYIFKFVKMVFSMIILLFYVLHVKVHKEDFVLTFFLFYLFSMLYESIFFFVFESNLKIKLKDKKEKNG